MAIAVRRNDLSAGTLRRITTTALAFLFGPALLLGNSRLASADGRAWLGVELEQGRGATRGVRVRHTR